MLSGKVYLRKQRQLRSNNEYKMIHWSEWDYSILSMIPAPHKTGRGDNNSYNDIIIFCDTESSKAGPDLWDEKNIHKTNGTIAHRRTPIPQANHVCAWTITLRAFDTNIVTLWGHRPSTHVRCLDRLIKCMKGEETFIYYHNLSWDWIFLRRFFFEVFGYPKDILQTKPHYPISIKWEHLTIKDSLILAQRSLDKWGSDLDVDHKKAKGKWDYDLIRNQDAVYSADELEYMEHDTLCGAECIQTMLKALNKNISTLMLTATGIPRTEIRAIGRENHARDIFKRMVPTFNEYLELEKVYHGGFTHGNRFLMNKVINENVTCYDFASSYPFCLIAFKGYPHEHWHEHPDMRVSEVVALSEQYCMYFKLCLYKVEIKDYYNMPMPMLQLSKCEHCINPITDNGRILQAEYLEIWLTEVDLEMVVSIYKWRHDTCTNLHASTKGYLPRYFTDYVFHLFEEKTMLKGGSDKVAYNLAKARLNSCYGMAATKCIKNLILEDWESGESIPCEDFDPEESYNNYLSNRNSILPYTWGLYCTALAMRNLFRLGACVDYEHGGEWLYSDTDSIYSNKWDEDKIKTYNDECKRLLTENGYGAVINNGREYWLGVAEYDKTYTEFIYQGAKRYCGRGEDGELHITVAGVPKKGAECLKNDINNFRPNFVFDGMTTGKKLHTYIMVDKIYTDSNGNEIGDSINLTPCDYLLDKAGVGIIEDFFTEEVEIQVYDEE